MRAGAEGEGCSEAGRLVISRELDRTTEDPDPDPLPLDGPVGSVVVGALVLPPADGSTPRPSSTAGADATALDAAFLVAAALVGGAGSSGWTGRRSPSLSALRRARSACASSMDDEWLLTPIPRDKHKSSASLFVRPSS
jgi:hypothetical protein